MGLVETGRQAFCIVLWPGAVCGGGFGRRVSLAAPYILQYNYFLTLLYEDLMCGSWLWSCRRGQLVGVGRGFLLMSCSKRRKIKE